MMHYIKVSSHFSAFTAIILEWPISFEYIYIFFYDLIKIQCSSTSLRLLVKE